MRTMIYGIGMDLVETGRIEEGMRKFPDRFIRKMYTDVEAAYCAAMPAPALHYAARFAAKEAFLKALGTGKSHGIGWRDVGIENLSSGQPVLSITGRAKELMEERGITQTHVSLTHTATHAAAVVVLEKVD
ncbi:MAG: holo-ACP synthase [Candidatus Sumerlaeaceae bacterium]|nr:holo-ACP synthase [Candidatus Sumerlaeaceae bacterium]